MAAVKMLLLIATLVVIFKTTTGQFQCFNQLGCSGTIEPLGVDARTCCLNTFALSYNTGAQCIDCVAFGFIDPTTTLAASSLSDVETGPAYEFQIGYIKRPPSVNQVIRGNIGVVPGTANLDTDFTINTITYTGTATRNEELNIQFRVDNVALEVVETAGLELSILAGITPPDNLILQNTLSLEIIDSEVVQFRFTETDYRSNEPELQINAVVTKTLRIANPVTFQVFPHTVQQAEDLGLLINNTELNVPANNNRFSPNRAQIDRTDRPPDFINDTLTVTFAADEDSVNPTNDMNVPIPINDDDIDEAQEEVFIIQLVLQSATSPGQVMIDRSLSLCRISDDDVIQIGFQNASYTFPEPGALQLHTIFLEKQDGVRTEQTYVVIIQASQASPPGVGNALPFDGTNDNDYTIVLGSTIDTQQPEFRPEDQILAYPFFLSGDNLAEGPEAFQVSSAPSERPEVPAFFAPTPGELFPTAFIIIADDDPVVVGFEQNFTVSEDVGSFEVCFRVINPPEDQPLSENIQIDLVVDTVAGTAGEADYTPIRSSQFDVFETLSADRRRACFNVMINGNDNVHEDIEQFSLVLSLDEFAAIDRSLVTIQPNVSYVDIIDVSPVTIGFIGAPYRASEDMQMIFRVGVIGGTILDDGDIVVNFSTADGLSTGRIAEAGLDYTAILNMQLTFNPSTMSIDIPVNLTEDNLYEFEEDFRGLLTLISGERATVAPNEANATIIDNTAVTIGFIGAPYRASEDMQMIFRVGVIGDTVLLNGDIVINFSTADGLVAGRIAEAGLDYTAILNMQLIFNSSTTFIDIAVDLVDDDLFESEEDFRGLLTLISGDRVTIAPGLAIGTIIDITVVCLELEELLNGQIEYIPDSVGQNGTFNLYQEGTEATHVCNAGFVLVGDTIRTCQNDSEFDGEAPSCQPIECEELAPLENGMITYAEDMTPNYELGTEAIHECDEGFFLSGVEQRNCTAGDGTSLIGVWTDQPPICLPIECPVLDPIMNGFITYAPDMVPNFELGTVGTYNCDPGFVLNLTVGVEMRTCEDDDGMDAIGVWSDMAPTCIPIQCPALDPILNGFITYNPDNIAPFDLNTVATYQCDVGFSLDLSMGNEMRTCVDDDGMDNVGVWTGDAPACVSVQCRELEPIVNGFITYAPDTVPNFDLGTVATYNCDPGFVLNLTVGVEMRICENDDGLDEIGVWTDMAPTCIPIECPPLSDITNGVITYGPDMTPNFELGTMATYECDEGFYLNVTDGNRVRTCEDDDGMDNIGVWSGMEPSCVPIECRVLDPIVNGFITYATDTVPNFDLGTVATYNCDPGFVLDLTVGVEMRTCVDDDGLDEFGVWTDTAPTCIPIQCPLLEPIENGIIIYSPDMDPDFDLGTVATYRCDDGFALIGFENRTCQDDDGMDAIGVWSGVEPSCTPINITRVNDTVIADPLMTVPLYVPNQAAIMPVSDNDVIHLCFEVHGRSDAYFNLVSDDCVSVNAHYQQIRPNEDINIIDQISIVAVATDGTCHTIDVSLDQCTPRVNGTVISNMTYFSSDIAVRRYPSRVRVSVPNCGSVRGLVMWVMCQRQTFWSTNQTNPDGSEFTFQGDAIRFVVARGLNLRTTSHGILGQFWNIPIEVVPYEGPFIEDPEDGISTFNVTINFPGVETRHFIAWLRFPSWELERGLHCLYAGDGHAGSVYEVPPGPVNGPVIEGFYTDYIVSGPFETNFEYSHFDSAMCSTVGP